MWLSAEIAAVLIECPHLAAQVWASVALPDRRRPCLTARAMAVRRVRRQAIGLRIVTVLAGSLGTDRTEGG